MSRRRDKVRGGKVWVPPHMREGVPVAGYWRTNTAERRTGTVLSEDLKAHIEQTLKAHAEAVQAGAADRAMALRGELINFARQLAGGG